MMGDLNNNIDWKDCLSRMTRNKKIEKAAIISNEDKVLCCSSEFKLCDNDISGFHNAFSGQAMMRLKLCGNCYTCFRQNDDNNTVVGKADNEILVLHKCRDFTIVGVGHTDTPGSCIYEVTRFGRRMRNRSEAYIPQRL